MGNQLNCQSSFQAGDHFKLNVSNSGTFTGTGFGGDFVGLITTGQQVSFINGLVVGNNALIEIANTGSNASSTTVQNEVGSLMGYGKQLLVREQFQAGDNLQITISNSGSDNSTVGGGHYVGFINNNAADLTASQLHLNGGGTVGNRATISLSNTGTYQGNNAGGSIR